MNELRGHIHRDYYQLSVRESFLYNIIHFFLFINCVLFYENDINRIFLLPDYFNPQKSIKRVT